MSETKFDSRKLSQSSSNGGGDQSDLELYTVLDGDSLNKIAAMHDTTPSKLAQINKMASTRAYIFPGQVLKLPHPEPPKPPTPEPVIDKDVIDLSNNFVRVNVKHLTEGRGIVEGTILLTSKLVMFDPYAHHPLVAESSVDKYQIILPMSIVVNAVILREFLRNSDDEPTLIYQKDPNSAKEYNCDEEKENDNELPAGGESLMYLRMRIGQPIGSKIKRDEMINTYGEANVKPDYWFIITQSRANIIFDFFHNISNEFRIYGVLDVMAIELGGLELVREGRDAIEAEAGRTSNRATVAKLQHQNLSFSSVDFNVIAPMAGESELMQNEERVYLAKNMPPKLEGQTWIPIFSTTNQGYSLQNMMRKLSNLSDSSPILMVLSDMNENCFGAFLSNVPASISESSFEGTGETFLFKLRPKIKTFKWTGENNFFYRADTQCLVVGSSRGKFGLWIDRDLNKGRSQTCATFDNEPLAENCEDFGIKTLEVWAFDMI